MKQSISQSGSHYYDVTLEIRDILLELYSYDHTIIYTIQLQWDMLSFLHAVVIKKMLDFWAAVKLPNHLELIIIT